jgi:putative N-acetyltransferase (TIGR04045 family)
METVSSSPPTSAVCRLVDGPDELAAHFAVRRRVFVEESGLFTGTDEDARDGSALHVVALCGDEVCGAVRLYPLDDAGLWQGDRLAVLPDARVQRLGALLVRFAVATAGDRGGHTMVAQIQLPNVRFFEHLGWHVDGPPGPYHGVMHQPMAIPLGPAP